MRVWSGGLYNDEPFAPDARTELRAAVPDVREGGPPSGEILFGQPDPSAALANPELRWVQITSAGYTKYDTPAFWSELQARGIPFTNSSSVYDEPCAQHLLAFLLADARRLPQSLGDRDWDVMRHRRAQRLLGDAQVLIVGYGAIARRLVELLAPFGCDIVAVRRRPTGEENAPTFPLDRLDDLLPTADHVINILPAREETRGFFDSERFARMKAGALYVNIGRGTTTDGEALLAALPRLAGAYLDVTDPEPLPRDHPLWSAPNVFITPHTGGGHRDEDVRLVRHFVANLRRFEAGEPLRDRIV